MSSFERKTRPFMPVRPGIDYPDAGCVRSVKNAAFFHLSQTPSKPCGVSVGVGSVKSVKECKPPLGGFTPLPSHVSHTTTHITHTEEELSRMASHTSPRKKSRKPVLTIIEDTREQTPLSNWPEDIEVIRPEGGLETGDYSIVGWDKCFAIERKSITDLAGTMIGGYEGNTQRPRKRFNNELERMRHFDCAAVIVTATPQELIDFRHHCGMDSHAALWNFSLSVFATYGIPVFTLTDPDTAARWIADLARHYVTVRTKKNRSREEKRARLFADWGF